MSLAHQAKNTHCSGILLLQMADEIRKGYVIIVFFRLK